MGWRNEGTLASHFAAQARNNAWSNHRLHRACAHLASAEYFGARASFFGSIHATLNHLVIVQLAYLDRMRGRQPMWPSTNEMHSDRESLEQAQRGADRDLVDFCDAASAGDLGKRVTFAISTGDVYTERVADVLAHLFAHQVHHRGQVHGMLSATPVDPPQLDEYFLLGDRPLRAAELDELGIDDG